MVLPSERHRRILQRLDLEISVSVDSLKREFGVTAMTIWRDLQLLAEQGLIKRVRGGAMKAEVQEEPAFGSKLEKARAIKDRLARFAVSHFINPGNVIVLEGGTTVAGISANLYQENLTILTNSLPVLNFSQKLSCKPSVYCCGGLLREESGTFVGREAVTFFSRRKADIFFMSATGLDLEKGITDPNPQEIEVKQMMARLAGRIILLADSGKFGQVSLMEVLPWRRITDLVTDHQLDKAFSDRIRSSHIRLHLV